MRTTVLWDNFKKLMPEESTRVESYKRDGLTGLKLTTKDGTSAIFSLGKYSFTYIKNFR